MNFISLLFTLLLLLLKTVWQLSFFTGFVPWFHWLKGMFMFSCVRELFFFGVKDISIQCLCHKYELNTVLKYLLSNMFSKSRAHSSIVTSRMFPSLWFPFLFHGRYQLKMFIAKLLKLSSCEISLNIFIVTEGTISWKKPGLALSIVVTPEWSWAEDTVCLD